MLCNQRLTSMNSPSLQAGQSRADEGMRGVVQSDGRYIVFPVCGYYTHRCDLASLDAKGVTHMSPGHAPWVNWPKTIQSAEGATHLWSGHSATVRGPLVPNIPACRIPHDIWGADDGILPGRSLFDDVVPDGRCTALNLPTGSSRWKNRVASLPKEAAILGALFLYPGGGGFLDLR